MSSSRSFRSLTFAVGAILALAALSPSAQARRPSPGYEQFAGCPSRAEYAGSNTCLWVVITGGHLKLGSREVPIERPMTLGGGIENLFAPSPLMFSSVGGLSKVKQKFPGGVSVLTGVSSLSKSLGKEAQTVYVTAELAAAPAISLTGPLQLPVKFHLENSVLGSSCYLGSNASPLLLSMTTGTTIPPPPAKPISGKFPFLRFEPVREIQTEIEAVMVDNAFAVPGANGCVLTAPGLPRIAANGLINSAMGLPAPAGRSEAVMGANLEIVNQEFVYP
jgi:hypothetical protein